MRIKSIARLAVLTIAIMYGAAADSPASDIPFDITAASFTPGSGYGVDSSEKPSNNPTLLDVRFNTSVFVSQSFTLNSAGDAKTFDFGIVNLQEPDAHSGIILAETDTLGVQANFTFVNPLGMAKAITATGTASAGSVSDGGIPDYTLVWLPVSVDFGDGGSFDISMLKLDFYNQGIQTQTATITLRSLPQVAEVLAEEVDNGNNISVVPEPTSLFLLGTGLGIIGLVARRRRK